MFKIGSTRIIIWVQIEGLSPEGSGKWEDEETKKKKENRNFLCNFVGARKNGD